MNDYVVDFKIRNGRIRSAMATAGFTNAAQLARAAGISQADVGLLLNLRRAPTRKNGEWTKSAVAVADALRMPVDELFTEEQKTVALTKNGGTVYVTQEHARLIAESGFSEFLALDAPDMDPASDLLAMANISDLERWLGYLTPQQSRVLRMRFGATPYDREHTLDEIAALLDVGRERVRQIEAMAMRKIRNRAELEKAVGAKVTALAYPKSPST